MVVSNRLEKMLTKRLVRFTCCPSTLLVSSEHSSRKNVKKEREEGSKENESLQLKLNCMKDVLSSSEGNKKKDVTNRAKDTRRSRDSKEEGMLVGISWGSFLDTKRKKNEIA